MKMNMSFVGNSKEVIIVVEGRRLVNWVLVIVLFYKERGIIDLLGF